VIRLRGAEEPRLSVCRATNGDTTYRHTNIPIAQWAAHIHAAPCCATRHCAELAKTILIAQRRKSVCVNATIEIH